MRQATLKDRHGRYPLLNRLDTRLDLGTPENPCNSAIRRSRAPHEIVNPAARHILTVMFANWLDSGRTIPTGPGTPLTPTSDETSRVSTMSGLSHKGRGGEIHLAMLAHRCGPVRMNRDKAILETVHCVTGQTPVGPGPERAIPLAATRNRAGCLDPPHVTPRSGCYTP